MTYPKATERFLEATAHLDLAVTQMSESTHTAAEAAAAVGAPVEAIVKSLVFIADNEPLLVLVSGRNRVNVEALGARLGTVLEKADAKSVKESTGYSIGGVPPFGHPSPLTTVMDKDLMNVGQLWAAAGSATTVFPIDAEKLLHLTGATLQDVS